MKDVLKYQHLDSDLELVFDDDGRVAYAYLCRGQDMIADVWLYNHGPAPRQPEWKTGPEAMPFRNSEAFVGGAVFEPITQREEIEVKWLPDGRGAVYAELFLRGKLHARLRTSDKPGECVLALKNGPVARVLKSE